MAWRALTRNDILSKLSGGELENIEAQLSESGTSLAVLIAQTTDRVRGYIAAHPANTLGPEDTLPERLIADTVAYLIPELWSHTAGMIIDLDDTRRSSADRAEKLFRDVASGRYLVEDPDTAGDDNKAFISPSVTAKTRYFTRDLQDGI